MNIKEEQRDLFTVPQGYYLAHCISGDYALGAGIAKQFVDVYNMRYKLHSQYPIPEGEKYDNVGKALLIDNVFNLVTKPRCYHKPIYETLYDTLVDMRDYCEEYDIVAKLPRERILELTHSTNSFLKSLVTKKLTWEQLRADMKLKGLKGKEYIHSIGKWDKYIAYLNKNILENK